MQKTKDEDEARRDLAHNREDWMEILERDRRHAMEDRRPEAFEIADPQRISLLTGIDMELRHWEFEVDETILPSPGFGALFDKRQRNNTTTAINAQRYLLDLFLHDVLHRPEFGGGQLQVFSDVDVAVNGSGRALSGRMDSVIGFGPDALDLYIPHVQVYCTNGGSLQAQTHGRDV